MFVVEAMWLAQRMAELSDEDLTPVLNIGSGNLEQRTTRYPGANRLLWDPLAERGVEVVHCDIKDEPGVDIAADLTTASGRRQIAAVRPGLVLCNNLYEHLEEPGPVARAVADSLRPGGHLLVTVPHSYPYHADPIDTMFRPDVEELAAMHPGLGVVETQYIEASTYRFAVGLDRRRVFRDGYNSLRSIAATRSFRNMYPLWWSRPYVVAAVHLHRPG